MRKKRLIVLAAVLACVVLVVCFAAKPVPETQDLSFLNYKNAIPLIGMNETAPEAVRVSGETGSMQPGVADGKALARFLENAKWTKRRTPSPAPEPRGYLSLGSKRITASSSISRSASPRYALRAKSGITAPWPGIMRRRWRRFSRRPHGTDCRRSGLRAGIGGAAPHDPGRCRRAGGEGQRPDVGRSDGI
jgi:hypothetical protein